MCALLGFIQTVCEADNWKKAKDAAAATPYILLADEKIRLYGIIAGTYYVDTREMRDAVPKAAHYYTKWNVCKCLIRKKMGITAEDTDTAVSSILNTVHCAIFDMVKKAMASHDTLTYLRVGDTDLARACTEYDKDACLKQNVLKKGT